MNDMKGCFQPNSDARSDWPCEVCTRNTLPQSSHSSMSADGPQESTNFQIDPHDCGRQCCNTTALSPRKSPCLAKASPFLSNYVYDSCSVRKNATFRFKSLISLASCLRPDGHPKLLHLWPPKLLQAGRSDYGVWGRCSGWLFKLIFPCWCFKNRYLPVLPFGRRLA